MDNRARAGTIAVVVPNALVVDPSVPARSVKASIALGKSRPGELIAGSAGTVTDPSLSLELFTTMAGTKSQ